MAFDAEDNFAYNNNLEAKLLGAVEIRHTEDMAILQSLHPGPHQSMFRSDVVSMITLACQSPGRSNVSSTLVLAPALRAIATYSLKARHRYAMPSG